MENFELNANPSDKSEYAAPAADGFPRYDSHIPPVIK